ncbi:MAG: hypothetical protein ACRDH6_04350 [Actinomycetota bacterium]
MTLAFGVLLGLGSASPARAFTAATASLRNDRARVESVEYGPGTGGVGAGPLGVIESQVTFTAGPETFVSIEITDASGGSVLGRIDQSDQRAVFCSSTDQPIRIDAGFPVTVTLYEGRCLDGTPSTATTGTVVATFFRAAPRQGRSSDTREYSVTVPNAVGFSNEDAPRVLVTAVYFPEVLGRFASLRIEDDSGGPNYADVQQEDRIIARFCGQTSKPIRLRPSAGFTVLLFKGPCEGDSVSRVTHGFVEVSFSES